MNYLIAAILGLIEGLTEFIPISSTGHLILAAELLQFKGEQASTFLVFIQLGAILSVVVYFRRRFIDFLRPGTGGTGFSGRHGLGLLALTTLPAVVAGLGAHGLIKAKLFTPMTVAIGLAAGGLWILVGERLTKNTAKGNLDCITWKHALGIGLFQCLALWPGVSRAAATIMGGLFLGLNRKSATEYSFFAAVPIMLGACLLDLFKNLDVLGTSDIGVFAVGFIVSFLTAWVAIKGLIDYVSHHTLSLFGWYRLVLAALVFLTLGR